MCKTTIIQNEDLKQKIISIFKKIAQSKKFQIKNIKFDEVSSLIICCFVDIMKITAPEIPFDKILINFYFEFLITWLNKFPLDYKLDNNLNFRFEYIINRFAKLNLLSLLVNSKFKNKIEQIIENFMKIVENGYYEIDKIIFSNIQITISNLIGEYTEFPKEVLRILILNLNKKQNKFRFEISKFVIEKNKNMLFTPISNLLMDQNYDNDNFSGNNFYRIVKELSKIGGEFLIAFFLRVKIENGKIIGKINNVNILKVILKIFSQENSVKLAINYKNVFEALLNNLTGKSKFDKKEIFKCLCKFLSRNDKEMLKKFSLDSLIKEKIDFYLLGIQDIKLIDYCLNLCLRIENRKIIKIICQAFINSKNNNANEKVIQFIFNFISEKIIKNMNLYDFESNEKIKFLKSISSIFNLIVKKLDSFQNSFEEGINKLLDLNKDNKYSICIILMVIFFFSMKSSFCFNEINEYFYKKYRKEIKDSKGENLIKKQFINFEYLDNIKSMLDFIAQYIIFVDDESNPNSTKVLNSMIYVIIYFIRYLLFDLEILIIDKYKEIIFQIFDTIKIIISNDIDNILIINGLIFLIKELIPLDDIDIENQIFDMISYDLSNFIFKKGKKNIKSLSFLIDKFNETKGDLVSKNKEILIPKDLFNLIKNNFTYSNPIFLINDLLGIDKNQKYDSIFFTDDLINYIFNDFRNDINEKISEKKEIIKNNINDKESFDLLYNYVKLYNETLKFQSFCLIKLDNNNENEKKDKEINLFIKFILNEIYEIFIQNEEEVEFKKKKETDKKEENEEKKEINYYKKFQYLCIEKYISLIFHLIERGIRFKSSYQIKIMNLLLCKNKAIRNYFIEKINSRIYKKRPLDYFFNFIPMITITFADPYKILAKKAKKIFTIFIDEIYKRMKNRNLNDISSYKYIPEVYISNIIVYCVFNNNLNAYFKINDKKNYFKTIFTEYFKIIKKNNFDSDFILRSLDLMKKYDLSKHKIIKKIFPSNLIFDVEYNLNDINYENTKNKIIDFLIQLINSNYITDFSYENLIPRLPSIFINNNIPTSKNKNYENEGNNSKSFILDTNQINNNISNLKNKSDLKENESSKILKEFDTNIMNIDNSPKI